MAILEQALEDLHYPTHDLEVLAFGDDDVKIQATLAIASVDGLVMEQMVKQLADLPMVGQSYWSVSTTA